VTSFSGFIVCSCASFCILRLKFWYFFCIIKCSFESNVFCMYCQFFPHRFARFKCIWYSLVFRCCFFLCRKNTAGMNRLKIINYACQGVIHEYENTKTKLLICNANIYFNKQCHQKGFTPNYAKIRVPGNTPATISTMRKARLLRIKEELKFLQIDVGIAYEQFPFCVLVFVDDTLTGVIYNL